MDPTQTAAAADQITAWYRQYLGRDPDPSEISVHMGNTGGLSGIFFAIISSPEAQAYKAKQGATPDPTTQTPAGSASRPSSMSGWQQWFSQMTQGKPYTPETLKSMEGELGKMGVKVLTNAAGVAGKIQLPDGTIVDVIRSAGLGGKAWQWSTGGGTSGGGAGGTTAGNANMDPSKFGQFMQSYDQKFDYPDWQGGSTFSWDVPEMPDFNPNVPKVDPLKLDRFVAPTEQDLYEDPSYKVRFAEGERALDASAAARGNLMTGGTLKALTRYGQDQASKEYGNVYARRANTYGMNTGATKDEYASAKDLSDTAYAQQAGTYGINAAQRQAQFDRGFKTWDANEQTKYRDWLANYNKALTGYNTNWNVWNSDQTRQFGNLYNLAQLGYGAASQ